MRQPVRTLGAFKNITVAVDGSSPSEVGVRFALSLAGDDTTLSLCSVVDPAAAVRDISLKAPLSLLELHAAARAVCKNDESTSNARGVSAISVVVEDRPARGILRCAHDYRSDLIVIGSRSRTGIARSLAGSITEEVIRLSDVPVAVAHADDRLRDGPIAVAVDASAASDAALALGIALARATSCELHLFHVFDRTDLKRADGPAEDNAEQIEHASLQAAALLEDAADRVRSSGVAFKSTMLEGDPVHELLAVIERHQCASLVIGTHAPSEFKRALFGSVAMAVVERARVPVFVVRRAERKGT